MSFFSVLSCLFYYPLQFSLPQKKGKSTMWQSWIELLFGQVGFERVISNAFIDMVITNYNWYPSMGYLHVLYIRMTASDYRSFQALRPSMWNFLRSRPKNIATIRINLPSSLHFPAFQTTYLDNLDQAQLLLTTTSCWEAHISTKLRERQVGKEEVGKSGNSCGRWR